MTITDRVLTAVKTFLEDRVLDIPTVRLRDWATDLDPLSVILDIEEEPEEDEEIRGQYEVALAVHVRARSGVDEAERAALFTEITDAIQEEASSGPDEWDLVRWMRSGADRGIGSDELGVYEMLVGGGEIEVTDDEVVESLGVTLLVIGSDLTDANFGAV